MRILVGFFCLLSLTWGIAAEAPASDAFQAVCADLRAVTGIEADFSEDKTLHILARPLHSKGTLLFSPAQGVYRVMNEPVHQELLITRSQVIQKNARGQVQRMSIRRQPAARAFVDVFLSFFSGDADAWKKTFDVSFSGTVADWQIGFVPRVDNSAAKALRSILLEGRAGQLDAMTLTEANGDVTHTVYTHQRPAMHGLPADLSSR